MDRPHSFRNIDPDYPKMTKRYFSGGAGLTSTAYDYAVFLQMLLNGGIYNGKRILSPRSVELMTSNQLDFHYNGINDFGLGFEIVTEKGANRNPRNIGSYSWGGYYGTTYWVDPKERLIGLVYRNIFPTSQGSFSNRFKVLVYQAIND